MNTTCLLDAVRIALLPVLLLFTVAPGSSHPVDVRQRLSARLDSLELAKQGLRRQGLSLDTAEEESRRTRDSLDRYRDSLSSSLPHIRTVARRNPLSSAASWLIGFSGRLFPSRRRDLFDWILTGAGFVGAAVALFLAAGILRSCLKLARRPRPGKRVHRTASPAAPPASSTFTPPPEFAPSFPSQEVDTKESLAELRHRVHTDPTRESSNEGPPPPGLQRLSPSGGTCDAAQGDIRARVIAAARQGLSVPQIARKLQIGVDQVSLIIKVARSRSQNNSSHPRT